MEKLKILIVEDEILIAETIKYYLEERGHQVTNIAISYDEAENAFYVQKPDIVLLDIRLYGEKSGIDFANFLIEKKAAFIYLTSQFDQRILDQALTTNPYGYLTKPIHKETLWTTLESAYNLFSKKNTDTAIITVNDGKNNHQIKVSDIIYIQADHVYSKIVTTQKQELLIRTPMKDLMDMLPYDYIINCHRSFIVNAKHIVSWNQDEIFLANDVIIPISRSRKKSVLEKLNEVKI